MGHFGFSYVGLAYLLLLFVPNILWARHVPEGYGSSGENKALVVLERMGQVLCTVTMLFFSDTNPREIEPWLLWLAVSAILMVLYECYWIRYFGSGHTLGDFYRPFLGIPLPGATLPVMAFLLLGVYGKLLWLMVAAVIFGIGHIGIHRKHHRELAK